VSVDEAVIYLTACSDQGTALALSRRQLSR
jgi:hypothetical protein